MTTRNAHHRPHCVDLIPGAFTSAGRANTSANSRPDNRSVDRQTSSSRQSSSRSSTSKSRSKTQNGAVRIKSPAPKTPRFRFSRTTQLSIAVTLILAGILWSSLVSQDNTSAPTPEVARASIPSPKFFFDDAVDALNAHFSPSNTQSALAANLEEKVATLLPGAPALLKPPGSDIQSALATQPGTSFNNSIVGLGPLIDDTRKSRTVTISPLTNRPNPTAGREQADLPDDAQTTVVSVAPGNTLSGILNKHGVDITQISKLLTDNNVKQYLSNLMIGQNFEINQLPGGNFYSLTTRVGEDKRITIKQDDNGEFAVSTVDLPVEKERVVTSGTIEQSLYLAAEEANLKQSTIMELADIFQWELDFAKDIRKGDQFSLVYDRLYRDGSYIGDGDILAAEFIRGGKTYRAIRFTTDDGVTGYYSPDGKSKRRTFMRHPVDVVRITSKFNPNRLHPVLHKIRAHRGVDYGSPYGSPIYATADGKVVFSGEKGAYGNAVILKHGQKFSTLYAHMSKIAGKTIVGKQVKQGDVIGYVGNTGRVTGAHLHYEFRVDNKQIDPLKVELPAAQPIDPKYLPELKAISDEMTAQMQSVLNDINAQVAAVSDKAIPANATTGNDPVLAASE